jgi:ATP synthase assembly factor FMC1, mitochondrial
LSSAVLNRTPLHARIRSNFAQPAASSAPAESPAVEEIIQAKIEEGEQFVEYLQAQRKYATLLERYNPGMGMDEEEKVRLTARRVGMNLPEEYKPE